MWGGRRRHERGPCHLHFQGAHSDRLVLSHVGFGFALFSETSVLVQGYTLTIQKIYELVLPMYCEHQMLPSQKHKHERLKLFDVRNHKAHSHCHRLNTALFVSWVGPSPACGPNWLSSTPPCWIEFQWSLAIEYACEGADHPKISCHLQTRTNTAFLFVW